MRNIDAAVKLIKDFEGLRLNAYVCAAGKRTIGYGHVILPGDGHMEHITEAEADALLEKDLGRFCEGVERLITLPLADNQFGALVSFAFNAGLGALAKSTLRRKLNAGDYAAVPGELMKWTKAGGKELSGLVRRRKAEAELWGE
jgi:lysozyme